MNTEVQRREMIADALRAARTGAWRDGARALLRALGYDSPKTLDTGEDPRRFAEALELDTGRLPQFEKWRRVGVVFQLTGDELPALARGAEPATGARVQRGAIDSFLFLAIDLEGRDWPRRALVGIVRELNRATTMPAVVLFRHEDRATLAVIDRRDHRRFSDRQVVGGRVSLVKDIDLRAPHRAHVEILADLSLAELGAAHKIVDFRTLYDAWLVTLSAAELNKRFYGELASWFAWASTDPAVSFPAGQGVAEGARETALIRLLTRLMFVWFVKEKGLVPETLFRADPLRELLVEAPHDDPDGHGYYLAILQNLFFATLNTEVDGRRWREDEGGKSRDYLGHHVYRHAVLFRDRDAALRAFSSAPFLNGGLFECLDVEITGPDDPRAKLAEKERGRLVLRVDGFSDQEDKQPRLPNRLFFGGAADVDLSRWFENRRRRSDVPGLIDLFERYKFTVEENTPLEEEAALDPELLGKVFENLLASYNEDTKTTARNKSGSFYTPREVVDFMIVEALVAWLLPKLDGLREARAETGLRPSAPTLDFGAAPGELAFEHAASDGPAAPATDGKPAVGRNEARLRRLLGYDSHDHDFSPDEVDLLIAAIQGCKAIDPAVGSGAFPLGLLQKLVHVLQVLDPGGEKWYRQNREYYEKRLAEAQALETPNGPAEVEVAEEALSRFDASFASGNTRDYTRKLYLIERCLHGVDVQPIAVQIAKLRCFISLAVEQTVDDAEPNRGVTPLPNLETKFVAANTLAPLHKRQLTLGTRDLFAKKRQLQAANRAFFGAANGAAKRKAQARIRELRAGILDELTSDGAYPNDDAEKLAHWDPFDPNSFAPFFDGEWMFNLEPSADEGWFDIVLANPPYVRHEKILGFAINGQQVVTKAGLKRDYETYSGTADLYVYFYERAVKLLKAGGALAFITSNKWYRAGYGKGLRGWLVETTRVRKLVDFGDAPVFEAIAYPTILVATRRPERRKPRPNETIDVLNWTPPSGEEPKVAVKRFSEDMARRAFAMPQAALAPTGWQMEPASGRDLLARLRARGTPLGEWCGGRFYYGIKTGLNEAFVIDGNKRAELIAADPRSEEIIKPFLRGRDVKRWRVEPADLWLIRIDSSENNRHPWTGLSPEDAERVFRKNYPSIYDFWMSQKLREKLRTRYDKGHYFWELRSCAYWHEFENPKILVPAIVSRAEAAPDFDAHYSNNKSTIFVPPSVTHALAAVNSAACDWFSKQTFASKQGGFLDFEPRYSGTIPIPSVDHEQNALISATVDAILAGAVQGARFEALINAFVYELFFPEDLAAAGLSPFAAARDAGLDKLAAFEGPALAKAADEWSRNVADPASPLYAAMVGLQAIDAVRIIEGR